MVRGCSRRFVFGFPRSRCHAYQVPPKLQFAISYKCFYAHWLVVTQVCSLKRFFCWLLCVAWPKTQANRGGSDQMVWHHECCSEPWVTSLLRLLAACCRAGLMKRQMLLLRFYLHQRDLPLELIKWQRIASFLGLLLALEGSKRS